MALSPKIREKVISNNSTCTSLVKRFVFKIKQKCSACRKFILNKMSLNMIDFADQKLTYIHGQ